MTSSKSDDGIVLVIGASGGVGHVLVRQLVERGYSVLGSVLNQTELNQAQALDLANATFFVADFSRAETGMAQVEQALSKTDKPLRAAVNCAAVSPFGPVETTPIDVLRRTLEINTMAGVGLFQLVMPFLRESGGRLILISSLSGKVAMPLLGYYTASKFALEGLADTMRLEAGQWGIPVTLIEPGAIATNMVTGLDEVLDVALARLDDAGRENYGHYFAQHKAFTAGADDIVISPETVASKIIEVLETEKPQARYVLGNAVDLLEARSKMSDEEMDAFMNSMLPGSRV